MRDAFELSELGRRLANIIRLGAVCEADYQRARVRVRVGDMVTGWLPWVTRRASSDVDWWAPEIGEQVVVLSPDGDPAQGVVLGSVYQQAHPAPQEAETVRQVRFADGTTVSYDRAASVLTVDLVGDAQLHVAGNATVTVGGDALVDIAGQLTAKGAVIHLNP